MLGIADKAKVESLEKARSDKARADKKAARSSAPSQRAKGNLYSITDIVAMLHERYQHFERLSFEDI